MISDKRKANLKAGFVPRTAEEKTFLKRSEAAKKTAAERVRSGGRFISAKQTKQIEVYAMDRGFKGGRPDLKRYVEQNEAEIKEFFEGRPNNYHINERTYEKLFESKKRTYYLNIEGVEKKVSKSEAIQYIAEMNNFLSSHTNKVSLSLRVKEYFTTGKTVIPAFDITRDFDDDTIEEIEDIFGDEIEIYTSPAKKK